MVYFYNLALIIEWVAIFKLIDRVLSTIISLSTEEQNQKKKQLRFRFALLLCADFIQVLWLVLAEFFTISSSTVQDKNIQNVCLSLIPSLMVSFHLFFSADFLKIVQKTIKNQKAKNGAAPVAVTQLSSVNLANSRELEIGIVCHENVHSRYERESTGLASTDTNGWSIGKKVASILHGSSAN